MQHFFYAVAKISLSALAIWGISELGRRNHFWGAILASLPLTSLMAFIWMNYEGAKLSEISALSLDIFWLVIPSLLLFLVLPGLIKLGWTFWPALMGAMFSTLLAYGAMILIQKTFIGPGK